ncbi:hypothetical protein [Pseudalkalibacillus berkeleyi]|uniref:Uncharacterized protein n=1 Tax=Pseudalkalibacillus berkeleyi TaxID=1069813 RepID=A0ABS9H5N8_9BACL|nr:hypothetical protein [Pseudalkalibacillus berkeleyi]MCF6139206.1 hypothetical protein [Pseudalkalibacillus berkeleyi]
MRPGTVVLLSLDGSTIAIRFLCFDPKSCCVTGQIAKAAEDEVTLDSRGVITFDCRKVGFVGLA